MAKEQSTDDITRKAFIRYNNFSLCIKKRIYKEYGFEFDCFLGSINREKITLSDEECRELYQSNIIKRTKPIFDKTGKTFIKQALKLEIVDDYEPELTLAHSAKSLRSNNLSSLFVFVPIPKDIGAIFCNTKFLSKDTHQREKRSLVFSKAIFKNVMCDSHYNNILAKLDAFSLLSKLLHQSNYLVFFIDKEDTPHLLATKHKNETDEIILPLFVNSTIVPDHIGHLTRSSSSEPEHFYLIFGRNENHSLSIFSKYDVYSPSVADKIRPYQVEQDLMKTLL